MKDTIKKYQTGGIVNQNPNVALANNQQNVLSEEELKFLTDKYGSNAQFNVVGDQSTTSNDTTITDEEIEFLKQKYGDNFQATVVSNQPQQPQNTISNIPISENPFEEFLGDADQSLTYKPENDPVRQKNLEDLIGSGVIIPRDVNPNHIKFEDASLGWAGSNTGYLGNQAFNKDKFAGGQYESNLKKAIFPNGEEYLFAPEGKTTIGDKLYDTSQYLAQGAVSGVASGLEFVNQVLWKFSGAEFAVNATAALTGSQTTEEMGITNPTKGIFYTPFTNQIRDGINKGTIKINPSDSYLATQKALDDKIKAGDVEGLLTDPLFWKSKFNDESFHREFLTGASSAVEFMTPGIGVNKLNLGTRLVDKMGDVGIIQKLDASDKIEAAWGIAGKAGDVGTSAFLMGSMEAHMEGENNAESIAIEKYNSLIPEDSNILPVRSIEELEAAPDDELKKEALEIYDEAYSNIFRANQVPLILSNVIPMVIIKGGGTIFKQVPGALGRVAQKFPKATATFELTTSGLSEMAQETYQSGVGNYERDKLINGLYPLDNSAWQDIKGSAKRAWEDFNVDPETTSAGVLGFVLSNSTVAPMEIANAYNQIKANKDTRKLLESYPTGNFHSIRNLFTKEGTVNTEELAKTVNSINQTIVNQKFVDEAAQMNDQELMDYAYQQSIAPIVYEAMEKGIDGSTVKTQIRELISSTLPKDKSFVDAEGNITKPSQLLDKRVEQVDWLMRAHAKATKIATKENLPEKVKQSLFSAIVGYNNFDRLTEKLAGEIRTVEGEIKATKEKLKRNQLLINDFNKEDANDILSGAILEGSVNDALDPTDASVKELNDLFDRYIDSAKVANDYNRIINKLLKKETVAEQRRLDRAVRIKDISSRKLKSERHKNTPVEIAPEVITNEIVRENPGVNKQDVEAEVRAEQTKLLKAKEQELKESLPALAREPGASYDALVNPKGEEIQEGEKSLRRNILNSELAKQKKEADEVPLENRYENRALLQEQETITLTQALENATPEELSTITDRFVELSNLPPTAVSAIGSFLNAPASERMKDPLYAQAVQEAYLEIPNNGDPFNQDLSGFDILNVAPLDPKLQGDQLETKKQEELTKEDNGIATETNTQEEPETGEVTPEIPETERERRNRNMINVFHKKIGDMDPEKVPLSYTPTFEEWFKGISYIHMGLLSPGDRIYLEIDPKVEHNRFANPGWRNLSVQAVTYTSTGERVVVGMLASYREQGQYPTATPELETLRNKLYDQWTNRTSQEEVIKTGYETAVQEIYKGHIEQITAAPGTQEQVLPSTYKALVDGKVNMNDVEIGMKTGLQKEQVPVSTNNVSFKMEQDRNTKDDATKTGWVAVLIKSHKIYKSKKYHYETFGLYTRQVKDVKGYREAILQGLRDNKIADVQMLVSFNEKVEGGPPIRGPRWEYSKEDQTINNRPIPANTPYIVLGRQVIVGAEDIYKELDLGNKAVNIDQAWLENYESKPKVPHPVYGKRDIKDIILKELTLSGLDASTINSYAFGENTKESLFHSGKFSVEPWSKPEVGPQGGVIRNVKAPETGATVRRRVERGKLKVQDSTLSFEKAPNIVWEDSAKAEQWFKERLAEIGYTEVSQDAIRKLANLPRLRETAKVWGIAQDAAVTLAKDRPEGTTRHEAFHIVFNLFLTSKQREIAYREAYSKYKPELEKKLGREVSKEEFETELKNDLFGSKGEAKFSLSDNLLSYIDNFNRRLSESNLPANLKRGLKISTNEYLPKKMKPEPRGKRDPLRGVMPQDDLNKFNDTSAVGLLNAALDQINNYISAEQRAINSLISIEHSIANNIEYTANKANLKGSEKITPFNQGNKFNLTSKYIEILKARGNDKIQLDKPFSAPGVSSQEKEILKKFYDSYIIQLEEFFKSKNKPVPKSIDASRLLNKYKDWLHENYPILHYESQKQIHTYGLSSGLTEHPDNKDLKQGWEVNISSGFLKRTGSHTYDLSYTDENGRLVDLPGKWDTLGWYIYHELYGDTPLFYEFQSDIIDMDDRQLEKLFDSSLTPPKDADGYSIYHKFIDTIRSFEERTYHELDTIEDILKDSDYSIKSKENLRKVINKKVGEIVKYKVERALRYKKLNDSGKNIDSLIEEEKNLIELAEKEIVSLLSIKYHFNNSAIKLPRRKYFGVRRALENLLKYTATPNITYPTSADKFKYDRSSFDSEVYKDTVLKYLNPVEFENYINYIQDYKDYLREQNNGYDPRDLSVDFDAFSGEAAEIYFNSIKLKGNNEVAQVNTGRITFVDQGNGRKKKQQETISVDDAIAKSKKKIKDSEFRIYNYTNQKKNPIITNFLDEYSKLQEERIKEFVNKQINDLPIPDIDFEKVLTNISTRVDKVKKELSRASNTEVHKLIDKINNPEKDVSSDSDVKKKLLEDVRGLKSHQLKLFITHAITYAKEKGHTKVYFPTADFINKVESGDPWTLYTTPEDQLSGKNKFKESHIGSFYEALMEIPNIKYNYVKPSGVNAHVLEIDISDINVGGVERFSIGTEDGSIDESAEDVYKQQGIMTMLEEFMADEFENLKQTNGVFSEGFKENYPKLAKFLQDLYNFLFKSFDILQQYVTDKRSLETLYRQIDNNSFGKNFMGERRKSFTELLNQNVAKRVEENSTGANYKITSIPLANISRRVSLVNRDLVNKVLSERDEFKSEDKQVRDLYTVLTKFPNGNDRLAKKEQIAVLQRVYELVKEELDFLTQDLILDRADSTNKEEIEELTKAIENTQIVSNLISLEFMTGTKQSFGSEAFDFTKRLIDDLVNSQGVIFKAGTVVSQEKIEKLLEQREQEAATSSDDYENSTESSEGAEITQEELDSYESWQMNSLAENPFNKISPRLKKEISSIPVMIDVYEDFYDEYGNIVKKKVGQKIKRDDLGAIWYHNAVEIFNTLVDEISSSSNQEVMMEKLAKSRDKHPEIDSVMAKIESYENSRQDGLKKDLFISIGGKYRMSHYVNLSDRVPNPRSQFGEMYDRVRIFNAARQKVEEKIFKKFYSNFNTINWNNLTNTRAEVIGRTSKFEGYTYDKMKTLLEIEDDYDQNMYLPDILAAFGFEITNDTRDYLEGNVGNVNKAIYANLTYMYNQMVNGINPTNFENETGQGGSVQRIKQISKDLRKADVNVDMKMFLDGKNKLISGHVQAGYAIKLFNDLRENILLNKDQTSKQAALDKFLLENDFAFYRNAPIIKWLEEGRDINLEFGYMDARKRNGAKEGTQITEMGEALMHINKFEYWIGGLRNPPAKNNRKFNYSWEREQFKTSLYNIAVFDSPKTYFLRAPVFESIDDVIDQYERVFNQENKRIGALKIRLDFDPNYTTGNKDLDENGLRYQFLPELNKDMPETWQQAEPKVREALESHFNDYLNILQGYGLIEFSNGEYHATDKMPDIHIGGQNLYDSLRMFYYNDSLMTSQTITLLSGDPASYQTNKNNRLTSAAYQKRNKQLHANGNYGTFKSNRPNYNVVYFKDVKLESDPDFITNLRSLFGKFTVKDKNGELKPMFSESTIDLIVKGYQNNSKGEGPHNTTDAQGYITLDRWKEVLEAYNEWDSKKQAMYDRLSEGVPTADDLFAVSQPLKPHYFGFNNLKDSNGEQEFKTPLQHKYSAIVLHPMLTKDNNTLEKIAKKMKEHQIDEAIFESGIKVGLTKIVTVEEFMESTEDFMSDKVTQASHKYYKQQQKVPEHYQGKVSNLLGIQLRKLLPSNMDLLRTYSSSADLINLDFVLTGTLKKELTGADLLHIVDKLQSTNINEQLDKLIERIVTTKEDGTKTTNINNVRNILLDAINDKGLNSNYGNAIEVRDDGRFKLPMSFPTIARKIEEILNSLFKKISKQTHNGGSYVNISSLGFDDDLKVRIDPETGEYYVEVAMPINNKLLGKNVATGEIEKIREGIVYRIPTEEKYSMFPIRVVKWLDPSVGGIIAMPREITSIAGLDFDIDKVYALLYNFEVDKKTGKLEVPRDIVSREGRENLLLDAYTTILSNANAAKDALRFQSVQQLKDIRGEISSKERPIHLSQSQVKFLTRNQAGKNLIGIFANHNSFHALANNRFVTIENSVLEKLLTGSLEKYKGKLSRDLGGIYTQTLGEGNEVEISRSFAMLLSAAVDNAKDPILDDLNINVFTAPILGLLLHMGIDMKSAIDRINEPDMIKASRAFSIDGLDEALKDPAVEQLSKTAKSLSKIISALRIDSGTGPTFHDVDKKIDDLMTVTNVEGSGGISTGTLLPKIGFDRTTNEYSIEKDDLYPLVPEAIKSYINVFLQEANFANLDFPYFKTQFKDNKTRLSRFKPSYKSTSAKNRRLADTEHQAILHYGLLVKPDEDVIGFLSEFPIRFTTFAANYNAESESKRYSGLFSIFNITKDSTLELTDKNALDNEAVQNIMDQWETALYDEQDPEIKQLANDLIKYGFIMDGYNFTQTSYLHLVPTEFWAKTEGFSEFKSLGIAEEHISLFTALNNPSAFIETFYESSFSHTKIEDLKKLVSETIQGVDYYLPAYAKKNGDQWDIYLNTGYVNSNYTNNSYLEDPTYTKLVWKNPDIQGRTYKIDAFSMEDLNINVKTVVTPNKLVEDKLDANANLENITETQPQTLKEEFSLEYTPENIQSLKPNEVFVFGSNAEGIHGKGAALLAKNKFGAKQGQSEGLQGQSYAVITKKNWRVEKSSTLQEIGKGLQDMLLFAKENPSKKFLVTKLGSSLAGYSVNDIKGLFEKLKNIIPNNVVLPIEYEVRDNPSPTSGMLKDEFTTDEAKDILDQTPDEDTTKTDPC
jgi:hypothetical protein